jgi:hypothetical protein
MRPEYVLALMDEIEKNKPLSGEHEPDGRFLWPNRWEYLKKMLNLLLDETNPK